MQPGDHGGIYQTRHIQPCQPAGADFPPAARLGETVCLAARAHGLLTRPILDTLVLLPPLCASPAELDHAFAALDAALDRV